MKNLKVNVVAAVFLAIVIFILWLLFHPINKESDPVDNASGSLPENTLFNGVKQVGDNIEPKIVVQDKEQTPVNEPVMSEADIIKLKDSVNSLQSELSALSVDLNENLENPEKRKQIEEQYLRLTEEYNKALIALVKSKQVSSAVSE